MATQVEHSPNRSVPTPLESADPATVVTTREAARFLRVKPKTLRSWASERRGDRPQPMGWNGKSNLYRLGDLQDFRALPKSEEE